MNDEEFESLSPEEQQQVMMELEKLNYPQPEEKASIFAIFKRVMETNDSSKVGNLDSNELYAVRTAQATALFLKTLNYHTVGKYFRDKSEIVLATSLSNKAKLIEAIITQKRTLATDKKPLGGRKPWKEKKTREE